MSTLERTLPLAQRWRQRLASAVTAVPPPGDYVIVAPHPDDETLTVGGLLRQLSERDIPVRVVSVTEGGAAYPGIYDHDELSTVRRHEQLAALEQLGVRRDDVISLGVRDGEVARNEARLADELTALCTSSTTLVAPWTHDVHTDHEAVGRAAVVAARRTSATLWSSLFWAWHRLDVRALDDERLIGVDVSRQLDSKAAALDCHLSQLAPGRTTPMLDDDALEPARWSHEYFIVDPDTVES